MKNPDELVQEIHIDYVLHNYSFPEEEVLKAIAKLKGNGTHLCEAALFADYAGITLAEAVEDHIKAYGVS